MLAFLRPAAPFLLLLISNAFMTYAWYGHLKKSYTVPMAILMSWIVALGEYCFQVPANRIGYGMYSGYQLKIAQEAITLVVFIVFAYLYLGESLKWNHMVAMALLAAAVGFALIGE